MKFVKSLLIGTGSVVLAGFVLTLMAPKALHALVATLVQVANTSANPAIVSNVDVPGRIPYQSQRGFDFHICTTGGCLLTFPNVPANHRVVVTHLSADVGFVSDPGQVSLEYTGTGFAGGLSSVATFKVPIVNNFAGRYELPVQFYVDAGESFQVNVQTSNLVAPFGSSVTATGYLLDCAAAPCSAIAQ
jgi:hypothetical protein